jgi:hypothetical protein
MSPIIGDNDKGFWEDLDVFEMNQEVLAAFGAEWHSTEPIAEADFQQDALQALRMRALNLLRVKLDRRPAFGMKDPRLSRLLPFWKPIFRDLNVQTFYLLTTRNPVSVSRSLQRRNGLPVDMSHLLWMRYTLDALLGTRGEARLCVDYDELMLDPPRQLRRLGRFLGRVPDTSAASEYCSQFLEQGLRRARQFMGDLEAEAGADSTLCRLYGLLRRAAIDDRPQAWDPIERFMDGMANTQPA